MPCRCRLRRALTRQVNRALRLGRALSYCALHTPLSCVTFVTFSSGYFLLVLCVYKATSLTLQWLIVTRKRKLTPTGTGTNLLRVCCLRLFSRCVYFPRPSFVLFSFFIFALLEHKLSQFEYFWFINKLETQPMPMPTFDRIKFK